MRYSDRSLPPHDVHVFFRETGSLSETAIATAVSTLSPDEKAQFARFYFARDARDYAAAHALLRAVLSRNTDRRPESWRFEKTPQGKPYLPDDNGASTFFSLSHTHGMVACAVTSGGDVGIDVESLERDVNVLDISARFFSRAEAQLLAELDPESRCRRFFDLWTLKEALVKAIGGGLAESLASLAFTIDAAGHVTLDAPAVVGTDAWEFRLLVPGPKHRLAVAMRRSSAEPAQLILHSGAPDA